MASSQKPTAFEFLPLGAIIKTFSVGDLNIVQGFENQEQYVSHNVPYFGETIGRVANRIKDGKIKSLNGKSYSLVVNNPPSSLHGGIVGWGKRVWDGPKPIGIRDIPGLDGSNLEGGESVKFTLTSEDGDEGYPGTVEASVIYTAGTQQSSDGAEIVTLGIEYQVELVGGADETVVNVTNHSYFNLSGAPNIGGTEVALGTNLYLPLDDGGIPIAGSSTYAGIESGKQFVLGPTEPSFDDCFVFDSPASGVPLDTRQEPLRELVSASHPDTGIHFQAFSTEPAFQFYTGQYIDVKPVGNLPARGARSGFCVEPSRYVNAVNVDEWRGTVVLKKGEVYGSRVVYRAWQQRK